MDWRSMAAVSRRFEGPRRSILGPSSLHRGRTHSKGTTRRQFSTVRVISLAIVDVYMCRVFGFFLRLRLRCVTHTTTTTTTEIKLEPVCPASTLACRSVGRTISFLSPFILLQAHLSSGGARTCVSASRVSLIRRKNLKIKIHKYTIRF